MEYSIEADPYFALKSAIPTDELERGDQILSKGSDSLLVCRGTRVIKIRIRSTDENSFEDPEPGIRTEIDAYQRLRGCEGVVSYHDSSFDVSITLSHMSKGSLSDHLESYRPLRALQRRWFLQMTSALANIHDKCIIHNNITTKHLLLDSNLDLHFCGFSDAIVLEPGTDMENTTGDAGCSIYTDMAQLGHVIFHVVNRGYGRPERSFIHTWLGEVIGKCLTGGYRNARVLHSELQRIFEGSQDGVLDHLVF